MDLTLFEWVSGGRFKASCKSPQCASISSIPMFQNPKPCVCSVPSTLSCAGIEVAFGGFYSILSDRLSSLFLDFCRPSKTLRLVRWSNSFLLFLIIFVWGEKILNLEFRSPSKRFSNICILHILCAPSPPQSTLKFYSPWKVKIPKK